MPIPPPTVSPSGPRHGIALRLSGFVTALLAATLLARGVRFLLTGRARLPPGAGACTEPYFLLYRLTGVGAVLLATWLVLRVLDGRRLGNLGLGGGARDALRAGARGAGLVTAIFVAGFAVLITTGQARVVGTTLDWRALALQAVPTTLFVGLYEELLFRGYLFQALAERLRPWPAILLVSAVFGAIHYPNPGVTALGAAATALYGVLLGALLLRTRSLWTCIGFHFAGNLVQAALLGSRASGMSFGASVLSVDYPPTLFAGAPSGLEAAAPTLLVALLALAWVLRGGAWSAREGARLLFDGEERVRREGRSDDLGASKARGHPRAAPLRRRGARPASRLTSFQMATHSLDVIRPRRPEPWNAADGPPTAPLQRPARRPVVASDGSTSRGSGALWAPSQGPCRPETGGVGGEPSGHSIPIRKDCWD